MVAGSQTSLEEPFPPIIIGHKSNRLTALGIDNYGRMSYRYGYEEIDFVDGTSDWVWNAPMHVFFLRLRELFDEELCTLYTKLEGEGAWSATSLINQFNNWQMQFPEELWRVDIERKYIRTYTASFINGEAKPEFLKERANGRKKTQRSQFERNQEKYMSSKFGGTVAAGDDIILRCSVPNIDLVVPANFDITLIPYSYVYLNAKYNTSPPQKIRAVPGQAYTIKYDSELADIIEIYSASCIKSIGDLSALYLINGDFSNASKIKELTLGNATDGYNNTNSMTLGLGSNDLLVKLDIQNMSGLTDSLDLSHLRNLEEVYALGSNITGVIFADGGNISVAQIPSIGSLSMKNLSLLNDDGFKVSSYNNLTKLVAENSNLDLINLINNALNLYQVRLIGIDWTLETTALLQRLYGLAGITNIGGNTDKSVLSGEVFVPIVKEQELFEYQAAWSDLDITYNTLINQFAVTFQNADGTVLEVQYVNKGEKPVDPLTRTENPLTTPTMESSVSTDFTYAGWDSEFIAVFGNMTFTATYSETVRQYTVKYVSKGNVLQETLADYGSSVFYEGEMPTYTLEETGYKYYLFTGWDKSGYVNGDKIINAVYDSCEYVSGYFDGKELADMRPVEIYAMTKLGLEQSLVESQDSFTFNMGADYSFDDVENQTLIASKTEFTGSNHIDTGIVVMDEDKDWVVAVDYEFATDGNTTGSTLMECYQADGSEGFKLAYNSYPRIQWATVSVQASNLGSREMLIIRHVKGEMGLHVYKSNMSGTDIVYTTLSCNKTMIPDSHPTLVFGASKPDSSSYENHAVGIIYWAKVWFCDLGDSACRELAGYIHEEITVEMCGFKRQYLSSGSSQRCSMSFLASHALRTKKVMNITSGNSGGWASTSLNEWLNTRFYNGLPLQIKQLIKQVKVKSSIGDHSTEVNTADCFIYVPALIELSPNYTGDPYAYEDVSIDYMVNNADRIRLDSSGNATSYWTRSPNVDYSYFWCIQESGSPSGYFGSNTEQGVVIEFSI